MGVKKQAAAYLLSVDPETERLQVFKKKKRNIFQTKKNKFSSLECN